MNKPTALDTIIARFYAEMYPSLVPNRPHVRDMIQIIQDIQSRLFPEYTFDSEHFLHLARIYLEGNSHRVSHYYPLKITLNHKSGQSKPIILFVGASGTELNIWTVDEQLNEDLQKELQPYRT